MNAAIRQEAAQRYKDVALRADQPGVLCILANMKKKNTAKYT